MVTNLYWPRELQPSAEERMLVGFKGSSGENIVVITAICRGLLADPPLEPLPIAFPEGSKLSLSVIGTVNYKYGTLLKVTHLPGSSFPTVDSESVNVILFTTPNSRKLEYYSTFPAEVDIFKTESALNSEGDDPEKKYAQKLAFYSTRSLPHSSEIESTLRHINLRNYLKTELNKYLQKQPVSSSQSAYLGIGSLIGWLLKGPLTLANVFITILIKVLSANICGTSLAAKSSSCHQLRIMLRNMKRFPEQCQRIRKGMGNSEYSIVTGSARLATEYIQIYNTAWLTINDLILGFVVSRFLVDHTDWLVANSRQFVSGLLTQRLGYLIMWLMNSPAGFKLNNELAEFLGDLTLWIIKIWENSVIDIVLCPAVVAQILPRVALLARFMGASFFLSVCLDLMNVLVFHVRCFYFASTRIYHWQLDILRSLFRLFYGKKYNRLRKRIDSNNYELDQLFFGIIIFTILLYLLPTVAVFYFTFVLARLGILGVSVAFQFVLIGLNYMPLAFFLLRFKRKAGLPGGILLSRIGVSGTTCAMKLQSRALSLSEITASHIRSVLRFNFQNLRGLNPESTTADVHMAWDTIKPTALASRIALGDQIDIFPYNTLF